MLRTIRELDAFLTARQNLKGSVGLVPTMGNLHEGHLSLLRESLKENDQTIVTIFVNPKQFLKGEDLDKYPRTFESDLEKIKSTMKENDHVIVFHPASDDEIYGKDFNTTVKVDAMDDVLCGRYRSGHFTGVTTVVYRLFSLCRPTTSYFGQKDYQQFKIIEKMTTDLMLDLKLKMMPISRDENGLALSSRNRYLNPEEKDQAIILPKTLEDLENIMTNQGVENALKKRESITTKSPTWQYLEILDAKNLSPINPNTQEVVIAGALIVGSTRLIDNRLVKLNRA